VSTEESVDLDIAIVAGSTDFKTRLTSLLTLIKEYFSSLLSQIDSIDLSIYIDIINVSDINSIKKKELIKTAITFKDV